MKIFVDTGFKGPLLAELARDDISGATTNPTLMHQAGVGDYEGFARELLAEAPADKPISFEVFAEDFAEMERQARKIATWGENVYVKIPVMSVYRTPSYDLVQRLSMEGVKLNVTAVFTEDQIRAVAKALSGGAPSILSVFAGRIADTSRNPVTHMVKAAAIIEDESHGGHKSTELLWASQREVLNISQAESAGCDIITATPEFLEKWRKNLNKDLEEFSYETVAMFDRDAKKAGFQL